MAVPVRRIQLSNGEHLDVHDTSGPYTDPSAEIDVEAGLPPTRDSWSRPDPIEGAATQLVWAGAGIITPGDGVLRGPGGEPPGPGKRTDDHREARTRSWHGLTTVKAIETGMAERSAEFTRLGNSVHLPLTS
jgi:hypothetical protein